MEDAGGGGGFRAETEATSFQNQIFKNILNKNDDYFKKTNNS